MSVHALHSGLFALPHVDAEERPSSHGVLHTRVMRRQIHPADDEEPVHLNDKHIFKKNVSPIDLALKPPVAASS